MTTEDIIAHMPSLVTAKPFSREGGDGAIQKILSWCRKANGKFGNVQFTFQFARRKSPPSYAPRIAAGIKKIKLGRAPFLFVDAFENAYKKTPSEGERFKINWQTIQQLRAYSNVVTQLRVLNVGPLGFFNVCGHVGTMTSLMIDSRNAKGYLKSESLKNARSFCVLVRAICRVVLDLFYLFSGFFSRIILPFEAVSAVAGFVQERVFPNSRKEEADINWLCSYYLPEKMLAHP